MPDLYGQLTPQGVLNGSLQTIVYADNYNDLTNKPSINSVELQGNKTAADLGLLTAGDIPVDSVNGKQGVVILDGDDIEYSAGVSISDQIDNVAADIPSVPVLSVNSKTGAVVLDGDDIEYEAGTSVNSKITDLEAEIGSGPVVSVNGQQGVVELDGTDINYSLTKTLNQKIDEVEASIPVVSYPVTSVNTKTGDVVLDGDDIDYAEGVTVNDQIGTNAANIGDLSELNTTDKSSLVGAVNSMIIKTNASWIANSSSAYGTTLTDSINVTAGVWLITWGHPTQSATLGCFVDGIATNSDISEQFMSLDNGLAYTKGCMLVRFTGNSTIKLCAGGSASVSFSDIGRGFLRAIKLK